MNLQSQFEHICKFLTVRLFKYAIEQIQKLMYTCKNMIRFPFRAYLVIPKKRAIEKKRAEIEFKVFIETLPGEKMTLLDI